MSGRTAVVMPTIPRRAESALATIKRLMPQCDQLYVHLDSYPAVPAWMPSGVRCFVHPHSRGPAVRFSEIPDEKYVIFVDDDLRHPADYVKRVTRALKRLGPRVAIAYHAAWWPSEASQYRQRKLVPYWGESAEDQIVTYVGSGTLAVRRVDLCRVDRSVPDQFRLEDDVWISAALARAGIRCVRPKSPKDWIRPTTAGNDGLWNEASKDRFKTRDACIVAALAMGNWKLTR